MPSTEALWEASSADAWLKAFPAAPTVAGGLVGALLGEESTRATVAHAAESLWSNLATPAGTTQFSTVIIIYVLLRRKWDTSQYLNEFMSAPPILGAPLHARAQYLGAIPEYTKWRNYVCDCLDVLHWDALSLSARAEGRESPVSLHLHLSRIVILVPVRELFEHSFTHVQAGVSSNLLPHNIYQAPRPGQHWRRTLLTWAHQDRYKARLAVIHAGALFWHVRRYASCSFMEPFGVFLSALVLWAFGSVSGTVNLDRRHISPAAAQTQHGEQHAPTPAISSADVNQPAPSPAASELQHSIHYRTGSEASPAALSSSSSSAQRTSLPSTRHRRMPKVAHLDRPLDDELVQHIIRSGDGMRFCLEGVDDLCSGEGPVQVLREAIGILLEQPVVWSVSETYAEYLESMIT